MFYSLTTFGFVTLWIVFLLIYTLYSIYKLISESRCCATHNTEADCVTGNENLSGEEQLIPEKHHWFLKRELFKLKAMILYLNKRSLHSEEISSSDEITVAVKYLLAHMKHNFLKIPTTNEFHCGVDNICNWFRNVLVVIQFFLRLLIVPLLLIQWLDEYAWNCVVGLVKNYCKETTIDYTFDQSMVISC